TLHSPRSSLHPIFSLPLPRPPTPTLFPYPTLFRSPSQPQVPARRRSGRTSHRRTATATSRARSTSTRRRRAPSPPRTSTWAQTRSAEHTSELQSLTKLVCRLLLEKKNSILNYQLNL